MKPIIYIIIFVLIFFSCNNRNHEATKTVSDIEIIEQTIKNSIGWAAQKDTSLLYSIIADDENYLEVHPGNNVVIGINQFKEAEKFWLDPRFKHVKYEIWDLRLNVSEQGNVAWFYCMLNDINDWDGKPACWENTRWTGVLEKRNGKWRMVQMHFSKPTN